MIFCITVERFSTDSALGQGKQVFDVRITIAADSFTELPTEDTSFRENMVKEIL